MKRVLLIFVFLFSTTLLLSQKPQVNIKAGATLTGLLGRDSDEFDSKWSAMFSVYLNTKFSETFMMKNDVQYVVKSFGFNNPGYYSYSKTDYYIYYYQYVQVLPFVPTYLLGSLQLFGAPYIGVLVGGTDNVASFLVGIPKPEPTKGIKNLQFGMELGIEREAYWGINFGIRYQYSFLPVFTSNSKSHYSTFLFTMGYNFAKKNWRDEEY